MRGNIKKPLLGLFSTIIIFSGVLVALGSEDSGKNTGVVTENESREIAKDYILNSPTYKYDGFNLEYKETLYPEIAGESETYTFIFEFQSKHGGYGDRADKMVTQVITPHKAEITVNQGEVTKAILDQTWNMREQKMLE